MEIFNLQSNLKGLISPCPHNRGRARMAPGFLAWAGRSLSKKINTRKEVYEGKY